MRIASKINAALFGVFACGVIVALVTLNSTIQPRFDEIERTEAKANHKRVTEALDAFTLKLKTATQDYAFWDETHRFIQDETDQEFITSNLEPEFKAVENLGVNVLIFMRKDGTVRWGSAYDLESQEAIEGIVEEIAEISPSILPADVDTPSARRGLIRTSKGLVLIAVAPILKSDTSGPPVGKVASAKMLDVEAVKQLTGVDFAFEPLEQPADHTGLSEGVDVEVQDDKIVTTSVVRDLAGQPLVSLKVNSSREVSRVGAMAIKSAMIMMILAGFAAIGVLWMFLRTEVVSRIEMLKTHFATAGSNGTIRTTAVGAREDEICELAQSFNAMADQVNHLRDALADSAYMTGLSEWAAGTLHNVRNGLAPVATETWAIERLFDNAWVRKVEIAAREHASADTAPERRLKLNAYLVDTATRIADVAKQTTELTGNIKTASKSVLEMVAEFERYAQRKIEFDTIDLLPLVKAVTSATVDARAKDIDVVLPHTSATINGNSIILRQVLSNILINAVEAIEGQPGRGRIEVSITPQSQPKDAVQISVADNGQGVPADLLPAIFKRGVSTRSTRTGGLGLHWCANAIKVLGGTIRAESGGAGCGTTIIVELPGPEEVQREAA